MKLLLEHFDTLLATPADVEHLNRAILTLAVQGKLVEQNPNDEPASKLLKRIRAEKSQLTSDGVLKNKKESFAIKPDDQLFELPDGWAWCRINDTGEAINNAIVDGPFGSNLVLSDYDDIGEYPVITISNIDNGFDLAKLRKINQKKFEELKRSAVYPGDLLVAKIGSSWGKVGTYPSDMPVGIIPANLLKITVNQNLSKEYVRFFLQSGFQHHQLEKLVKFTAQPAFNVTAFKQLLFPLPPLAEQKRIVAQVETLFAQTRALAEKLARAESDLAGLNRSTLAHLLSSVSPEEFNQQWDFIAAHFESLFIYPEHVAPLRQSILELAVRGKLTRREAGDESARELLKRIRKEKEESGKKEVLAPVKESEKPFDLPDGWEWCRWDDVSLTIGDVDHKMPEEVADGVPYISPRDFTGKEGISFSTAKKISRQDYENLAEKIKPERGDIIFPRYGTIGVNRFVSVDFDFLASYSCAIVKHMKGLMNPRYVFFYSISPFVGQECQRYVNKTTQPNVGIKSIQKFLFPLPPLAEQARIVARVEQLLGLCEALESRLRAAQEERSRLVESVLAMNNVEGPVLSNVEGLAGSTG